VLEIAPLSITYDVIACQSSTLPLKLKLKACIFDLRLFWCFVFS
jgi:hypothetical protein